MARVIRMPAARTDIKEILDYLDRHSSRAADRTAAAIKKACRLLGRTPLMGRARDELAPGIRSVVVEGKYLIFYRVVGNIVEVIRVIHGARDIQSSMFGET